MLNPVQLLEEKNSIRVRENVWKEIEGLTGDERAEFARLAPQIFSESVGEIFHPLAGIVKDKKEIVFGVILGRAIAVVVKKTFKFLDILNVLSLKHERDESRLALEPYCYGGYRRKFVLWQDRPGKFGVGFLTWFADRIAFEAQFFLANVTGDGDMKLNYCSNDSMVCDAPILP